jgi:hypothetical protein
MRDRSMIGTTLRVASFALAVGLIVSPASGQTYGGYGTLNGGHSAAGTGGGEGGESGSGATTERYSGELGVRDERQPVDTNTGFGRRRAPLVQPTQPDFDEE